MLFRSGAGMIIPFSSGTPIDLSIPSSSYLSSSGALVSYGRHRSGVGGFSNTSWSPSAAEYGGDIFVVPQAGTLKELHALFAFTAMPVAGVFGAIAISLYSAPAGSSTFSRLGLYNMDFTSPATGDIVQQSFSGLSHELTAGTKLLIVVIAQSSYGPHAINGCLSGSIVIS